jgi:hypothetical protein
LESLQYVCHLALVDSRGLNECSLSSVYLQPPREKLDSSAGYSPILVGKKSVTSSVCVDPDDGHPKLFFLFDHIGIRMTGTFQLVCVIVDLSWYILLTSFHIIAELKTCMIEIYSSPIPGEEKPTTLWNSLLLQSIIMLIQMMFLSIHWKPLSKFWKGNSTPIRFHSISRLYTFALVLYLPIVLILCIYSLRPF